ALGHAPEVSLRPSLLGGLPSAGPASPRVRPGRSLHGKAERRFAGPPPAPSLRRPALLQQPHRPHPGFRPATATPAGCRVQAFDRADTGKTPRGTAGWAAPRGTYEAAPRYRT